MQKVKAKRGARKTKFISRVNKRKVKIEDEKSLSPEYSKRQINLQMIRQENPEFAEQSTRLRFGIEQTYPQTDNDDEMGLMSTYELNMMSSNRNDRLMSSKRLLD